MKRFTVVALMSIVMAAGFMTAAIAQTPPPYVGQFGSIGAGNGQFNNPYFAAIDPTTGNVFVADNGNNRIEEFTSTGTFIRAWGANGSGQSQFIGPKGVSVDSSGYVYVADTGNNRIQKFTTTGTYVTQWGSGGAGNGQFNTPYGVRYVGGFVYVGDSYNNRIQKFTTTGTYVTQWGSGGAGNGQFNQPQGIWPDASGNLYVGDVNNNRIQKFTPTGAFISTFGSYGTGAGQLKQPACGVTDQSGNVYIPDFGNNRISQFTSTGTWVMSWGTQGSGNGQFSGPMGIMLSGNTLYVTEYYNNRIQYFGTAPSGPPADTTGSVGGLQPVRSWGTIGSGAGQFNGPFYPAVSPVSGNVYVADMNNDRVQVFNRSGEWLNMFGSHGSGVNQFNRPAGVATDANDNLYVADRDNNRVVVLSNTGSFIQTWGTLGSNPGQFNHPTGVFIDPGNGHLYVVDRDNARVQEFTNTGVFVGSWGFPGSGNGYFSAPTSAAVDDSSNVYVVDTGNQRVQKFTPDAVYAMQWGTYGSGPGQFNQPTGISISHSHVYIVDNSNNRFQEFTTNGVWVASYGRQGSGQGQFSFPTGSACDANGFVYIADNGNNRMQKWGRPQLAGGIIAITDVGPDQGGYVRLTWLASQKDSVGSTTPIIRYDIFRQINPNMNLKASRQQTYSMVPNSTEMVGWDYVTWVPAFAESIYNTVVPTIADSNYTGMHVTTYFVRASTATIGTFYDSAPDSGYSKDNIGPSGPKNLVGQSNGSAVVLNWSPNPEGDLLGYNVYRGATANFVPSTSNLVAVTTTPSYTDAGVTTGNYAVAAVDSGANVSPFATASVGGVLAVGDAPQLVFALGVQPNPSRGNTLHVQFTLPTEQTARIELVDIAGRVATRRDVTSLGVGKHTVDLADGWKSSPGVYFVRLTQNGHTLTSRVAVIQ